MISFIRAVNARWESSMWLGSIMVMPRCLADHIFQFYKIPIVIMKYMSVTMRMKTSTSLTSDELESMHKIGQWSSSWIGSRTWTEVNLSGTIVKTKSTNSQNESIR